MKWLRGFGLFWYDFIVGDSVVLAIGGAATLVLGFVVARLGSAAAGQIVLPAAVIATLAASLRRT